MNNPLNQPQWQAIIVGSIAGSRASLAPAITSSILAATPHSPFQSPILKLLGRESISRTLKLMAVPELILDKIPGIGNRTALVGLGARIASGSLCGAALYQAKGHKAAEGALLGGLAAFASTFALFYLRKKLAENTFIPDAILGAAEDALAISSGVALVN